MVFSRNEIFGSDGVWMKLPRFAAWACCLVLVSLCAGCGDSYRPVAYPIIPPSGDPQQQRLALVVFQDQGTVCQDQSQPPCKGATSQIDVSGDTNMANVYVGRSPVHAVFGANVAVANSGDDSLSLFATLSAGATATTVATGSSPSFVAYSSNTSSYYAVDKAANQVTVLSSSGTAQATVAVGTSPVAVATTPDGSKVYVVNQGSGDVSILSTVDNTKATPEISVGASPSFVVANGKSDLMYVLNSGDGSITVFDAFTSTLLATVQTLPAGANSSYMAFNAQLQRLYVANPGDNSVSVLDTSDTTGLNPLQLLGKVSIPGNLGTGGTGVLSNAPTLAPLADGSRVYVLGAATTGCNNETGMGQVAVITTSNNTIPASGGCVTVGAKPVAIAGSSDSSKVYVAYQGIAGTSAGGTAIIDVANNSAFTTGSTSGTMTTLRTILPPPVDPTCVDSASAPCDRMIPVFVTSQ